MNWIIAGAALAVFLSAGLYVGYHLGFVRGYLYALRNLPKDGIDLDPTPILYRREKALGLVKDPGEKYGKLIDVWPKPIHYTPSPGASADIPASVKPSIGKPRGRPRGSLSAGSLPPGTKLEDIMPFIRMAKNALVANDGSFSRLCQEYGHIEGTVRGWIDRYGEEIDRE